MQQQRKDARNKRALPDNLAIPRRLPLSMSTHPAGRLSDSDQAKTFTKKVGFTPLGCARVTIRLQESIPKHRRTETQTFVFLNSFFQFLQ
jgi:hypothetical protein